MRLEEKKKGSGHARQVGALGTRTISGHSREDPLRKIRFLIALSLAARSDALIVLKVENQKPWASCAIFFFFL